jgi:hypothetical protein
MPQELKLFFTQQSSTTLDHLLLPALRTCNCINSYSKESCIQGLIDPFTCMPCPWKSVTMIQNFRTPTKSTQKKSSTTCIPSVISWRLMQPNTGWRRSSCWRMSLGWRWLSSERMARAGGGRRRARCLGEGRHVGGRAELEEVFWRAGDCRGWRRCLGQSWHGAHRLGMAEIFFDSGKVCNF